MLRVHYAVAGCDIKFDSKMPSKANSDQSPVNTIAFSWGVLDFFYIYTSSCEDFFQAHSRNTPGGERPIYSEY